VLRGKFTADHSPPGRSCAPRRSGLSLVIVSLAFRFPSVLLLALTDFQPSSPAAFVSTAFVSTAVLVLPVLFNRVDRQSRQSLRARAPSPRL